MDDGYEQTQALNFDDSGDETDEDNDEDRPPIGYLKVLCQKGFPEKSFPLHEGDNVIGRHVGCQINVPLTGLSREHACIEVKGQSVFIYDKASRNRSRRNKHFLTPEVRYELRDKDKLIFGDVECVYQVHQRDNEAESGSETGSESMFETAPIDQVLEETTQASTLQLPVDTDYQSDGSSDILEPTQPFGSQKKSSVVNNNSTLTDQNKTHNITVKDTPAPSKTKRFTDNLVLPESGSETDEEDASTAAPTLAVESQHSDEESPRRAIMGAPTQAYVCESDEETEEEVTPKKRSLLMAATQAYVEEDDEDTPQKRSILTAATQAYVGESDESGDEQETPVKARKKIAVEPTQAYTLASGIEPTQAYCMDEESNDGSKEETDQSPSKTKSLLYEPTQAYVGDVEDEDSNQGETEKKSMMYEPTQAYPGKAGQDQDNADSDTSEEFVLNDDGNDKDDDEDMGQIFMAPTLACDDVEDSNQSEPSVDSIQEMETQAVVEDQTQVMGESGKKAVKSDDATQVFTDDATQVIDDSSKPTKKVQIDNDGETQVFTDETQVFDDEKKTAGGKEKTGDEPTQVFTDETQVFDEVPETHKAAKCRKDSEEATQVFTDATLAVEKNEALQRSKTGKLDDLDSDSEQPTQVFADATMAVEDLYHQNRVKKKGKNEVIDDISEAATQVFQDSDENVKKGKQTKRTRGKGKKKAVTTDDTEAATQEFVDETETASSLRNRKNKEKLTEKNTGPINEDATQMFTQGVEEDDSERELIIRAVATLAAEEIEDDSGSAVVEKKEEFGSEDTTQGVDATVAVSETETVAITEGGTVDVSDTVAITNTEKEEETATVAIAEPEPTVPISDIEEKTKTKGRGRKTGKNKTKAKSNIDETATQVLDNAETLPVPETEEKVSKRGVRNKHFIPDIEPETQIYSEMDDTKVVNPDDEAATQVIDSAEIEENSSRRSRQNKKKDLEQKTSKTSDSKQLKVSKEVKSTAKVETVELSGSTRSRSRRGKQPIVDDSSKTKDKALKASAASKRKGKIELTDHEEATQAYVEDEEPTQRYSDGDEGQSSRAMKGRSAEILEDEDLTPPLSEETYPQVVPDSEETVTSPIIPAPPLVSIPSRSPHKSAMASPDKKKKSPSPKRVQFVSQGSHETEPPARGRRGRKVLHMEIEAKAPDSKKEAVIETKPAARRGRRSIQPETKTAEENKDKSGRNSLPAVLEVTGSNKESPSSSNDVAKNIDSGAVDNEEKVHKGRKGRNAKQTKKSIDDSKVNNDLTEQSAGLANKNASKRSAKGGVANVDLVSDKTELPETSVSSSNSTRQSSRSKNKQTEAVKAEISVEPSKAKVTRTKVAEKAMEKTDKYNKSVEIPETSYRTRTKEKNDSQDIAMTSKRGTRKTGNISKTEDIAPAANVVQGKGSKHRNTLDNSKTDNKSVKVVSENSVHTEISDRRSRAPRRKGKESESQECQTNETKTRDSKASVSVIDSEAKQTRTSRRKGRNDSLESESQSDKIENTTNSDLKEITNVKNHVQQGKSKVKETKGSDKNKDQVQKPSKMAETTGKLTRGKVAGPSSGSGDAHQTLTEQTPAKRRKTTVPEPQTVSTPKTTSRRATIANVTTPKHSAGKAPVGTPKGNNKIDTTVTSSPSLRRTDHAKPKVMFTGVTDEHSEKIVKELGGEMVTSVYDCTHLVTDQVRRTVKFLCCLSRGIPILTPQWLMSSKRTSVFSDPAPFLIHDHTSEKKFKFSMQLSLDKAGERSFLSDYKIHVTKSVRPEPNQMKDIIQCAGAKYLASIPKTASEQTIVISCDDDKASCDGAVKAGIPVVSAEFILTGALRQEADLNSYRLFANGDKRRQSTAVDSEPTSKKRKR